MSAPTKPVDPVEASLTPGCPRCAFHRVPCPDHLRQVILAGAERVAQLERQVAVLTDALGELGAAGGAA